MLIQKKHKKAMIRSIVPQEITYAYSASKHFINQKKLERQRAKQNHKILNKLLYGNRPIKLELGSPRRVGMEEWTFIDLHPDSDIQLDLSLPLPFPDNCAQIIYSSHLFEHFFYPHPLADLILECHRVLIPGGTISVVVPNAQIFLEAYNDPASFDSKSFCKFQTGLLYKSKIDYVNYMAYMGGHHKHMFDEESIQTILMDSGFVDVCIREFNPEIDLEQRKHESIHCKGTKTHNL